MVHTILLHMVNNFISSVIAMFVLRESGMLELATATESASMEELTTMMMGNVPGLVLYFVYLVIILALVLAGVVLLIVKRKKFTVNHVEEELPKGKRFSTVFLNVGMGLFCVLMIAQIILQLLA